MKQFTLKDPRKMGENDEKYGQSYWSFTHDQDTPVMFNLMSGEVGEGSVIEADTVEIKTSSKGTEYHRLKKVKVNSQGAITTPKATNDELILAKLDEILGLLKHAPEGEPTSLAKAWKETTAKPAFVPDEVIEDIGDGPIDLSAIPFN